MRKLDRVLDLLQRENSSPVSSETRGNVTGDHKVRQRVVEAAMTPRDYINRYLDDHPELEAQAGQIDGIQYRDLAALIATEYSMDFSHVTVYRTVKARREGNK